MNFYGGGFGSGCGCNNSWGFQPGPMYFPSSCGCGGFNNYGYGGNNSYYAIILVLFILLVIVIGARGIN